jgi:predicted phosphoadenosine phosphosulfate sulfurtransferase
MAKIYSKKNVYEATQERYDYIFNEFDNIYFSVSGGKDSSVMLQLALQKAKEHNKKIDVLFIDLEAQYKETIKHVEDLLSDKFINKIYWICLPLSLRNAVSILQPKWICWDKKDKAKWVREMPKNKSVVNESNCKWEWVRHGMEFEEFIILFAEWYSSKEKGLTACGIGIRSDESLNRFTTIISESKTRYNGKGWTTRVKKNNKPMDVYNFFPLYDWGTEDIWGCVFKYDLKFNYIYELMYKNGLSIHEARLCQPYGDDQRNGLDQFKAIEYETWEKVLNRVNGVNFGNIYCRTSLLGNLTTEKPEHMNWQEYTVFLLESIGLYAPELEEHYYDKIKTAMKWWEEKEDTPLAKIVDTGDLKLESQRKIATWRRIARSIEKNDFWVKRLSFAATKSDVEKLNRLKEKYKKIVGDGKIDKDMERYLKGELIV